MKKYFYSYIRFGASLIGWSFVGCFLWIQGCSSTPTTTAFNASTATDAAVRTAMTGWGLYVAAEHPSSNSEQQVWMAFESVKAGEIAVLQAESQLATNSSATNLLVTAENALGASISGLTNVINALTNTPSK